MYVHILYCTLVCRVLETILTPERFAEILCDDLELPTGTFLQPIAQTIRQQLEQFNTDIIPQDEEDRRVVVKVCMYSWFVMSNFCVMCGYILKDKLDCHYSVRTLIGLWLTI